MKKVLYSCILAVSLLVACNNNSSNAMFGNKKSGIIKTFKKMIVPSLLILSSTNLVGAKTSLIDESNTSRLIIDELTNSSLPQCEPNGYNCGVNPPYYDCCSNYCDTSWGTCCNALPVCNTDWDCCGAYVCNSSGNCIYSVNKNMNDSNNVGCLSAGSTCYFGYDCCDGPCDLTTDICP